MGLDESIARIPLSPHLEAAGPLETVVSSGAAWRGLRLEQLRTPPSEVLEGYLTSHMVVLHLSGSQTLHLRWSGQPWTTHRFEPGSVHVVPAQAPFTARWEVEAEWIALLLAPELVSGVAGARGPGIALQPGFGLDEPLLAELLLALRDEVRAKLPAGRAYAEQLGAAVAAQLAHKHADREPRVPYRRGGLSQGKLRSVVQYIHQHLDADLALDGLAEVVRMNVHYFVRSFRQSTGLPPHQYVLRQRIERAKGLLEDPRLSLAEVALRSGFANQSNFTTAFRRLTSLTPGVYRHSLRSKA